MNRILPWTSRHPSLKSAIGDLADRLCAAAIVREDECTWLTLTNHGPLSANPTQLVRTLSPEVYDGASGVALALLAAQCATGNDRYAEYARRAIKASIGMLERSQATPPRSFYVGVLGVVHAALLAQRRLGTKEFEGWTRDQLRRLRKRTSSEFDLIGGRAGVILCAVTWSRRGVPSLESVVRGEAKELLDRGVADALGLRWKCTGQEHEWGLTGLAHGAAGAACALTAAGRLLGRSNLLDGGRAALAYEDTWYSPTRRNWADLRSLEDGVPLAAQRSRYVNGWCHGAPGIVLGRMHLENWLALPAGCVRPSVALSTVQRAVERNLKASNYHDRCLCHGLAGNTDVLLDAQRLGMGEFAPLLEAATSTFIRAVHEPDESLLLRPGLMLGCAGILYLLSRMAEPAVDGVLLAGAIPTLF